MNIGIVGSRKFKEKAMIGALLDVAYTAFDEIMVVSGRSPGGGPDIWAEEWADSHNVGKLIHPIEPGPREEFRSRAMARNTKIINDSGIVIAFWDGDSNGTANSVTKAVLRRKPTFVVSDWSDCVIVEARLKMLARKYKNQEPETTKEQE